MLQHCIQLNHAFHHSYFYSKFDQAVLPLCHKGTSTSDKPQCLRWVGHLQQMDDVKTPRKYIKPTYTKYDPREDLRLGGKVM
jgi:hypothetical protein